MASVTNEMQFGNWPVTQVENTHFTLSDGNKLAMKLWLPCLTERLDKRYTSLLSDQIEKCFAKQIYDGKEISQEERFPVILEYLPYCKDSSLTLSRDYSRHPWFASHGFINMRVDIRGTGISTGYYYDEYDQQELDDCIELINWLGKQPWCNGNVGMYGKSWGGFNGLQVAYMQPEALKTVISLYSTDNRFTDDIHYEGGTMIGSGMLSWSAFMTLNNVKPPNPKYFSDFNTWKSFWLNRLQNSTNSFALNWMHHQHHDDVYWKHGSIFTDYLRIQCPVLVVGGHADSYTNAAFRMAAKLNADSRAVIGPWDHQWPDIAVKGPNIDYLNLCLKWFNTHLKAKKELELSRMTLFLKESTIHTDLPYDNGRWYEIDNWDSLYDQYKQLSSSYNIACSIDSKYVGKFYFDQENLLSTTKHFVEPVELEPHALQGADSGLWYSVNYGYPGDQLLPNTYSATWISQEFKEDVIFLAFAKMFLHIKARCKGRYALQVRLCDQFPSGESKLITKGCINLNSTKGDWGSYFEANSDTIVGIELHSAAYTVKAGHKLLISISPTYFPLVYPSLNSKGLVFSPTDSFLMYQTVPDISMFKQTYFDDALPLIQLPVNSLEKGYFNYDTKEENEKFITEVTDYGGICYYPDYGYQVETKVNEVYTTDKEVTYGDIHINAEGAYVFTTDKNISTKTISSHKLTADKQHFRLSETVTVVLDDETIFSKTMENDIPRKCV